MIRIFAENIYFTEKGCGETLILLHGNGESSAIFKKFTDVFSKERRVIAIDTRGHGKTPEGEEPFSIGQFAEDLKDFMDYHKIEKADILGFSDGGNIALIFASRYPHMVNKLIINGANTKPSGIKSTVHIGMWLVYIIASVFSKISKKQEKLKKLYRLMLFEPNITSDDLKNISAVTMVLAGTDDIIKESHTRFIAKNIPHSELCFVLGGHFILKDNFKDYCFAVKKFLDK